jgi:hypothetical protein
MNSDGTGTLAPPLTLTAVERIAVLGVMARYREAQAAHAAAMAAIEADDQELGRAIADRLGVDIATHKIDFQKWTMVPTAPPGPEVDPPSNGEAGSDVVPVADEDRSGCR